jgi:hypothetical protein
MGEYPLIRPSLHATAQDVVEAGLKTPGSFFSTTFPLLCRAAGRNFCATNQANNEKP